MNIIENYQKNIPIIEEFIPILEKEIQKWNGKVMNKKFYTTIEKYCLEQYEKAFPKEEQTGYKVSFYAKESYIHENGRALEIYCNHKTYTLLDIWNVEKWQTKEKGKQPRINATAIIENLHRYSKNRKEKLTKIKNTLADKQDIMNAYKKMVELAVFISKNKYDTETMTHEFKLDTRTLDNIHNVRYAGNWLEN